MRRTGVVLALLATVLLGGCGADSEQIDTSGIDELVIPTPSPDPDDFVGYVDNPYFPLEQGSEWTYDGTSSRTTVTVEPSNLLIAGVKVTLVQTVASPIEFGDATTTIDYYAQDDDGNVWWFGRQGVWDVETGGEAGLAMPADPRVGDGWRRGFQEGVVEDRLTVEAVGSGLVVLRVESDLEPGVLVQQGYRSGIGLLSTAPVSGSGDSLQLVSGP